VLIVIFVAFGVALVIVVGRLAALFTGGNIFKANIIFSKSTINVFLYFLSVLQLQHVPHCLYLINDDENKTKIFFEGNLFCLKKISLNSNNDYLHF